MKKQGGRTLTKKRLLSLIIILLIALVTFIYNRYQKPEVKPVKEFTEAKKVASYVAGNVNIALGNPSNATNDPVNKDNYLLEKPQYILSYNNQKAGPNWVSWHLEKSDIGKTPREDNFHPEETLPDGFNRVKPNDYAGNDYDRGHLCNAKDRSKTRNDMDATFSMANMLPQAPDLNRQVWENLESYCRTLVTRDNNEMYIIAGGYGARKTIGKSTKVNVPTNCWKVILVFPQGDNDLDRINNNTRVIAVDMPNINGIASDRWQKYITTVRDIEDKTGYDFFSKLPQGVQDAIENKKDAGRVQQPGV
jgi:endonuclease G